MLVIVLFGSLFSDCAFAQFSAQQKQFPGVDLKKSMPAQTPQGGGTQAPPGGPVQAPQPPMLSSVEANAEGYVLNGRGFGGDRSKVVVMQDNRRVDAAEISDGRITVRVGESVRPRGATEHKVIVAGQASNAIVFTHPIPPPTDAYPCAPGFDLQVDKVGVGDRCTRTVAVSCGRNLFGGEIRIDVDHPGQRNEFGQPRSPFADTCLPPAPPGLPAHQNERNRRSAGCERDFTLVVQQGPDKCEYSGPPGCPPGKRILARPGPDACTY